MKPPDQKSWAKRIAPSLKRRGPIRKATAEELKCIRELVARAGGPCELQKWIRFAVRDRKPGRPPGSTKHRDFDEMVLAIANSLALAFRKPFSFSEALNIVITHGRGPFEFNKHGANRPAIIRRLREKARADDLRLDRLTPSEISAMVDRCIEWLSKPGDENRKRWFLDHVLRWNSPKESRIPVGSLPRSQWEALDRAANELNRALPRSRVP